MCGIAGFAGYNGEAARLIGSMVGEIIHRGPDDDGVLVKGHTAIGMRRLSIIDIAHGHQPVTTQDGTLSIVFNGEIYNYLDVKRELESLGRTFKTNSDTETILLGFQTWGPDILSRLRGMFAFAIYDHRDESLFIARDRMGIKPLYYARVNGQLVFGSEIKSLLFHPDIEREVNPAAIDDYLSLRYVPGAHTLFAGIEKFPPAHFMLWKNGSGDFKRYWTPNAQGQWSGSHADAQEAFDQMFDETTRMHMISEAPVGAFLSGGLDSTAIVTSLTRQFPQQSLKTFSVGFGWKGDELSAAAQTARELGCEHHEIVCRAEHTNLLGKIVWHLDEPIGDGIVLPMYLLSQLASERVTVVQSGEGADEILGGYFMHRVMKWANTYSRFMPRLAQSAIIPMVKAVPAKLLNIAFDYPGDLGEAGKNRLIEFLSVLGGNSTEEQYRFIISLFSDADKAAFYTPEFKARLAAVEQQRSEQALLEFNDMLALQFEHWLPDDILCKLDKIGMAHSIEGRVPFMDHKLVELVMSMPASYKMGLKGNKLLLRDYLARKRTADMARKKKVPFYIPINQYLASDPLKGMVAELLSEGSIRRRGMFRWEAIRSLQNAQDGSGFLFGKQIFAIAMLELWHRIYIDKELNWI